MLLASKLFCLSASAFDPVPLFGLWPMAFGLLAVAFGLVFPEALSLALPHGKLNVMKIASGSRFFTLSGVFGAIGGALLVSMVSAQTPASSQAQSARQQTPPQTQRPATPGTAAPTRVAGDVARGDYLVNNVALCVQCHSPRDQRGNIIPNERLTGGPLPVRGPSWDQEWAYRAPALAGLPGFTDEQIVMLLTEGHAGDRPAPRRPMPPFRMNRADAEAIASYLRSR